MSETVTLTGGATAQIYGTFAGAIAYLTTMFGDRYTAWLELVTDDQKRTLAAATRFLDRQTWVDAVDAFALRDALVSADGVPLFQVSSYELAALVSDDSSVLDAVDQGTNIKSADAGGAGVTYFNPTSAQRGTATKLPQALMDLVGVYLSASESVGPDGGSGSPGSCRNPFAHRSETDRTRPF